MKAVVFGAIDYVSIEGAVASHKISEFLQTKFKVLKPVN